MSVQKRLATMIAAAGFLVGLTNCGPKGFIKGNYDSDVNKENLLNDQWSETDMQNTVKSLVESMVESPVINKAKEPPLVMVTNLQNKTDEHIDTQSVMDMVRVELTKTGKVDFVDKEARADLQEEYNYQDSGMMNKEKKKGPGQQESADYIVNGRLDSITQEVGKDKTVYYKITLNLTDISTNRIKWTDQKQIRKVYKKKTIGL